MLDTFYRALRNRLDERPLTDGGVAVQSPAEPDVPPNTSHCPSEGCHGTTELVAVADLLDSEDQDEWAAGNRYHGERSVVGRCTTCDTIHTNVPDVT